MSILQPILIVAGLILIVCAGVLNLQSIFGSLRGSTRRSNRQNRNSVILVIVGAMILIVGIMVPF